MKNISKKIRKEIAEEAVKYLKNRMMINQTIISSKENKVDFDIFMELYNKYSESTHMSWERLKDDGKMVMIQKDDVKMPIQEMMRLLRADLVRTKADVIVLSEKQIDELMGYVKESIETCGLGDVACVSNETFFLRGVLRRLRDYLEKITTSGDENTLQKLKKVQDFTSYVYLTDNAGFCETISGRISQGYSNLFDISTYDFKKVCDFNEDGVNTVTEPLEKDILLADKMYFGRALIRANDRENYEEYYGIFLEVEEDGKRKMKFISYDNNIYDIYDFENNRDGRCSHLVRLNEFLQLSGLSFLAQDIYTEYDLQSLIQSYNNSLKLTNEEKEHMEKVIEVATEWWSDAVCHPKFDNGDQSEVGTMTMMLAMMNHVSKPAPQEDTINEFKRCLGNKIRRGLLCNPNWYRLSVDYDPDRDLSDAAREAKISVSFPWKTNMHISTSEVSVSHGYGAALQILWSAKEEKMTDGNDSKLKK